MALPTAYATEKDLALLMAQTIGPDLADTLQWTLGSDDAGSYTRAVYAALRLAGVSDITDADDMDALEAAARVAVWGLAMQQTAVLPATSVVELGADLSSIHQQAREQYKRARVDALRTGINYSVTSTAITYTDAFGLLEEES
jgi:hypothetical protein